MIIARPRSTSSFIAVLPCGASPPSPHSRAAGRAGPAARRTDYARLEAGLVASASASAFSARPRDSMT
jgi:hypothetical protein